jgi:hypothetical protein
MKDRIEKQVLQGEGNSGKRRVSEEGKGGWIWSWYFLYRVKMNFEICQGHFKKKSGERENNGGEEPNCGTICVYMET